MTDFDRNNSDDEGGMFVSPRKKRFAFSRAEGKLFNLDWGAKGQPSKAPRHHETNEFLAGLGPGEMGEVLLSDGIFWP